MNRPQFPGAPVYLAMAAAETTLFEAEGPAGRIGALLAMANLCAQAADAAPEHVEAILAKAEEFRDQLTLADRAAELMLAAVRDGLAAEPPDPAHDEATAS